MERHNPCQPTTKKFGMHLYVDTKSFVLLKFLLASASVDNHFWPMGVDQLIFWSDLEKLPSLFMYLDKLFSNKEKIDTTDNMMFKCHKINLFVTILKKKEKNN